MIYQYNEHNQALMGERMAQFRNQVAHCLDGELGEEEFLPLRLQNDLYLQKRVYMLRVAIPYGILSSPQPRALVHITHYYDRGYGHFTTRQNIQFDWIELEQVGGVLEHLADMQMHAIQTSGNCVRNVATGAFAGTAVDEWTDPRPLAEIPRQQSTVNPKFLFLSRKFKIALSSAVEDHAAVQMHDIGLYLYHHPDAGELHLRVLVGDGLGHTLMPGQTIRDDLPWQHLPSYVEVILRAYNRYGRRNDKYRTRVKILVKALGIETFVRETEEERQHLHDGPAQLATEECQWIAERFILPHYLPPTDDELIYGSACTVDPTFARWASCNVQAHKVPGYVPVALSTKPGASVPLGDVTTEQMERVADWAERYSFDEIRMAHEQNLVLPDARLGSFRALWCRACVAGLGTSNQDLSGDIIAYPGNDYYALANARSIPIAQGIQQRFEDFDHLHNTGELNLNISGYMNACGYHHIGNIDTLGVGKDGSEWYQVTPGGAQGRDSALGRVIRPSSGTAEVPAAIERVIETFTDLRVGPERFINISNRVGLEPFKARVYARMEESV